MQYGSRANFVLAVIAHSPKTTLSERQQAFVADFVIGELAMFHKSACNVVLETTRQFRSAGQPENLALVNAYTLSIVQSGMMH